MKRRLVWTLCAFFLACLVGPSWAAGAQTGGSGVDVAASGPSGATGTSGSAASPTGEKIAGTFLNSDDENKPVAGVKLNVTTEDGAPVAEITSDSSGLYTTSLPGPGRYSVELQTSSLPAGVILTDPTRTKLTFSVTPGQEKSLIFPFGKAIEPPSESAFEAILGRTFDGARLGLIIAMTAIGLSLIYGTTQFTNFAHGEMVTSGAVIAYILNVNAGLHIVLAGVLAFIACGLLGYVADAALWSRLRKKRTSPFSLMVVSFGLSISMINFYQFLQGTKSVPYGNYRIQDPLFNIGTKSVPPRDLFIMVVALVILVSGGLYLKFARFGKAIRAVSDNKPLAAASGINVDRVVRIVWVAGSALAGLGGVLYALEQGVKFDLGQSLLLLMFSGITLGGLGTSFGAAAGCFLLGIAIQQSTAVVPTSIKNVGALVILILILMFRPQGVFGSKERVG